MTHTGLARGTAFETLRVAAELRRRPLVRQALLEGRISYSAARIVTRAAGAAPDVDAALIELATSATVTDLDRMVAVYLRFAAEDRLATDPGALRAVRVKPRNDGTTIIEITLPATPTPPSSSPPINTARPDRPAVSPLAKLGRRRAGH